jgi:hypothetical protein
LEGVQHLHACSAFSIILQGGLFLRVSEAAMALLCLATFPVGRPPAVSLPMFSAWLGQPAPLLWCNCQQATFIAASAPAWPGIAVTNHVWRRQKRLLDGAVGAASFFALGVELVAVWQWVGTAPRAVTSSFGACCFLGDVPVYPSLLHKALFDGCAGRVHVVDCRRFCAKVSRLDGPLLEWDGTGVPAFGGGCHHMMTTHLSLIYQSQHVRAGTHAMHDAFQAPCQRRAHRRCLPLHTSGQCVGLHARRGV